jgi:hypothetical protein
VTFAVVPKYIALKEEADDAHKKQFPKLHRLIGLTTNMHLHKVWLAFYVVIFAAGLVLSVLSYLA